MTPNSQRVENQSPPLARDIAVKALIAAKAKGPFVRDALDSLIVEFRPSRQDASLANELALGATRHRLTLDRVLETFLRGRLGSLDRRLLAVLRVGAYQLIWLDRIPEFAAVDSAVEQAKNTGGRKAGGLVNALLRQIIRHRREHTIEDAAGVRPERCILVDNERWRVFDKDLFPSPGTDLPGYLAASTSHPVWLVRRWLSALGESRTRQVCRAGSLRPPLVLRANQLRSDVRSLADRLANDEIRCEAGVEAKAVFVRDVAARQIPAIAEGLCQPQDVTSQSVVRKAPPSPGQRVLDMCAGPGTKTTQLAEYMKDDGLILACDRSADKLALIENNCRRMGVSCVQLVPADEVDVAAERCGPFDLALVDPPCCNSGVLSRRPEARYRIKAGRVANLAEIQFGLLQRAARHVGPKGKAIYATCSIEPEENDEVIKRFLTGSSDWRLIDSKLTLPFAGRSLTDWRDGGFVAVMAKR